MTPTTLISRAAYCCGSFLLDLIFPEFCISCRAGGFSLCSRCIALLPNAIQRCPFCSALDENGDRCRRHQNQILSSVRAVFDYDASTLETIIHGWKYRPYRPLGSRLCERLHEQLWQEWLHRLRDQIDYIVPIPLHPQKKRERGFNQASDLANELSKRSGIPSIPLLCRTHIRPPQASLESREARLMNAAGAFALRTCTLPHSTPRILLVDDILTTGATMESAANALQPLSRSVAGWCLARGTFQNAHLS